MTTTISSAAWKQMSTLAKFVSVTMDRLGPAAVATMTHVELAEYCALSTRTLTRAKAELRDVGMMPALQSHHEESNEEAIATQAP